MAWLVVGLGNPGPEYAGTYHNVGFRVLFQIAERFGTTITKRCVSSLVSAEIVIGGQPAVLALPQTFMNLSGTALPVLFERFDASARDLIVVYDDVALPVGKIRIRRKGSAGGHNGIKSLISACESDEFLRVRVGVLPERPIDDVRDFVLSVVARPDRTLLKETEAVAGEAVEALIAEGPDRAMNRFNRIDLREAKEN
jgi:peptidyl-tRNA hydrolase, PTH1 family